MGLTVVVLYYVLVALVGGIMFIFFESRTWEDLRRYRNVRHLVLAAGAGFLWYLFHSEWGWPNAVVAFLAGWTGPTFIESMVKRLRPPERSS